MDWKKQFWKLRKHISEKNAKVKIARLSRVFGPTMLQNDSKASSQFIKKALSNEDIVLKSNGEQLFSYTYVADAVSAMLSILINGENSMAYNISGFNIRLKDFAQLCASAVNRQVIFEILSEVEQRGYSIVTTSVLDNSRLKQLGWQPSYNAKNAIERTLNILCN